MGDNLQWVFSLTDKMSGPARDIARNLRMVENVTKAMNRTPLHLTEASNKRSLGSRMFSGIVNSAGSLFGPRGARAVLGTASALTKADDALSKVGLSLGGVVLGGATAATAAIAAMAGTAAYAGIKLSSMAIDYTAAGAKFVLQSTAFREDTLLGLQAMLKSKQAAASVYSKAIKFAAVTPFDTKEVVGMSQGLIGMGFGTNELPRVMTAIGDMAAARGMNKELITRLSSVMGQIRAKGRLQGEESLQLSEAGLNQGELFAQIGTMLGGKTADQVRKLQEQGKIDSKTAIEAILRTVEKSYGGTMALQSGGLTGLMSTLQSRGFDLVNSASGDNGGISAFHEKTKSIVKSLGDVLDPDSSTGGRITLVLNKIGLAFAKILPSGEDVASLIDKIVTGIERLLPDVDKLATEFGGTLKKLMPKDSDGIESFGRTIINVLRMVNAFVGGFVDGLSSQLGGVFQSLGGKDGDVESMRKGFAGMGEAIGIVVGRLIEMVGKIAEAAAKVTWLIDQFTQLTGMGAQQGGEEQRTGGASLGQSLVDGFLGAVTGGGYNALNAGMMLGRMTQLGLAYVNQSHSPSRVFAQHGEWATQGYIEGMQAPDLNSAVRQTFALPAGGLGAGSFGGGTSMSIGSINVSAPLSLAGADTETAKAAEAAVERLLPSAVAEALEGALVQMGAT